MICNAEFSEKGGESINRVYITSKKGDATKAAKPYGKGKDIIVCCGGDGTLNETITGIQEADLDVSLGYIPAGSTNDFANSLRLANDVVEAAKQIVSGEERHYDIGKFNEKINKPLLSWRTSGLFNNHS